ncbi:uncharacterized protein LOC134289531 [Aedes albopictus]|uniref:Reverse transcriptase/retrotransposon-derived protein RNase H-like domain-containing protein n=1 Tax=Aedes albopictus TaxID=7160 RepID=A0ABM1Y9U5_AEDAL
MVKLVDPIDDTLSHCYLPHHPVFKESSPTTNVRVVFDASCKTASGYSVNDLQLVGPVVQDDLLSIHTRFRSHQIAFVADVEKMYWQTLIHPHCRRILWRFNPSQPIATNEMETVMYGFGSTLFLATRTVVQIVQDSAEEYPAAAPKAEKDFYVDDFMSGSDDSAAGFPLKKWASNSPEALADVPAKDLALAPYHDLQDTHSVSTLGLIWEPTSDMMSFKVHLPLPAPVLTRRKIMSYIAQIFDPLGLVGPVIVVAKLFMQRLWALKTEDDDPFEWDRTLPANL